MTFRTIQGIPFRVRSPSLYEVAHSPSVYGTSPHIEICAISFNEGWHVDVLMKSGHSVHRGPFHTLNDAVALIAGPRV